MKHVGKINGNEQVLHLWKQGLSVPDIAMALDYDVDVVTAIVELDPAFHKPVALEVLTQTPSPASEVEQKQVFDAGNKLARLEDASLAVIEELLMDPDTPHKTRANLATYIYDQRLGLKKPKVQQTNIFNVFDFNERMRRMKARKEEMEQAVDVEQVQKLVSV